MELWSQWERPHSHKIGGRGFAAISGHVASFGMPKIDGEGGLRQRHRLRSPLYIQEDCRSDCRVKVSQLAALREDRKLSFIMTCGRLAVKARCDQPGGLLS